jgi:hypothetical protein
MSEQNKQLLGNRLSWQKQRTAVQIIPETHADFTLDMGSDRLIANLVSPLIPFFLK